VRVRTRAVAILLAATALVGCSDDDAAEVAPTTTAPITTTTGPQAEAGGIDVPELPGTFAAPVPSLGFGIAVPVGWNATLLSEQALERLDEPDLAEPFFLEAARNVASTGALFYAAGIDDEGRVAEIKIDVQDDADTDPVSVRASAEAAVIEAGGTDVNVVEGDDGRVRVDFRLELTAADADEQIDAFASQLFVPDGDRLWSIIVTSETAATQDAVLAVVDAGFVLD